MLIKVCKRGHKMTPENTIQKLGNRCRSCEYIRSRAYRERRRLSPERLEKHQQYMKDYRLENPECGTLPTEELVTIGYKDPLQPTPDGFGYMGAVSYNKEQTLTQCHVCGWLFKNLGCHVARRHKLKAEAYRIQFGLLPGRTLVAPNTRMMWINRWKNMTPDEKITRLEKMYEGRRMSNAQSGRIGGMASKFRLEKRNMRGSCPDQLLDKIAKLAKILGRTPQIEEFRKHYGGFVQPVYVTFGNWTNAVTLAGLTPNPKGGYPRKYTKEVLTAMLLDFKERYGREPYFSDIKSGLLPYTDAFRGYWGTWVKAKEAVYGKNA